METWKKVVFRAAGFGAGVAIVAVIVMGLSAWWMNRPKKAKPWNANAITAMYSHLATEGEKNHIEFFYILQNNTDSDYRVYDGEGNGNIHLAALLKTDALAFSNSKAVTTDFPIYLPARSRAQFIIHLAYPYPDKLSDGDAVSTDARYDYQTKVARYVTDRLSSLQGFVLMDDLARYRIEMKQGWSERAKEPLRIKTPDAVK